LDLILLLFFLPFFFNFDRKYLTLCWLTPALFCQNQQLFICFQQLPRQTLPHFLNDTPPLFRINRSQIWRSTRSMKKKIWRRKCKEFHDLFIPDTCQLKRQKSRDHFSLPENVIECSVMAWTKFRLMEARKTLKFELVTRDLIDQKACFYYLDDTLLKLRWKLCLISPLKGI